MAALKQSTAVTVQLGPFLDATDGVTEETALASGTLCYVSKNGAAFAARNSSTGITHDRDGWFRVHLDATDTNTLGRLVIQIQDPATGLPMWRDFMVMPANVWDSLYGSDLLNTDPTSIGGSTQSLTDLKDFADEGYDPATNKVQGVVLVDTTTTNTDMVSAAPTAAAVADAVWDELRSGHVAAGSFGEGVASVQGSVTGSVASVTGSVQSVDQEVNADVTKINGDATAAANAEADYNGTGYNKTNSTIGTCTANSDMRGTDSAMLATEDGSSFTAVPWNAAWDAEVQSECADALTAFGPNTTTPPTAAAIATEIFDTQEVETGVTFLQYCRAMGAVMAGLVTGGPGGPTFQSIGGSTSRVAVTADTDGNRSVVTLTLT